MGEQKNITCVASILMVTSGKVYILGQNAPICHTETKTISKMFTHQILSNPKQSNLWRLCPNLRINPQISN